MGSARSSQLVGRTCWGYYYGRSGAARASEGAGGEEGRPARSPPARPQPEAQARRMLGLLLGARSVPGHFPLRLKPGLWAPEPVQAAVPQVCPGSRNLRRGVTQKRPPPPPPEPRRDPIRVLRRLPARRLGEAAPARRRISSRLRAGPAWRRSMREGGPSPPAPLQVVDVERAFFLFFFSLCLLEK